MPTVIEVKLTTVSCTINGFGGAVEIDGTISGATFNNDPSDPAIHQDPTSQQDIYSFPNGPIKISQGETVPIQMNDVDFPLSTLTEPPGLFPIFLRIGGTLNNGLGSNTFVVRAPVGQPGVEQPFNLMFQTSNLEINLGFMLLEQPPS